MSLACKHLAQVREVTPSADGCEDCLRVGDEWDRSFEPGEDWRWCYVDDVEV